MQQLLTQWVTCVEPVRTQRRCELNEILLPQGSERPIRNGKFVVRKVPIETYEMLDKMLLETNGDSTTMNRLWKLFRSFQEINPGENASIQLSLFLTDMIVQGVKASSVLTYGRLLLEAGSRAGVPIRSPIVTDVLKALNLQDAVDEVSHAPDVDEDDAWKCINSLVGRARLTGFFLLAIGCRCADALHLQCRNVSLREDGKLAVSFKVTKNHRSALKAYTVLVKPRFLVPELLTVFRSPPDAQPALLSCTEFNLEVQKTEIGKKMSLSSYSFRRCFIQNIISKHTSGDITDWLAVTKLTAHFSTEVLRTKYTKPFDDTL